MNGFLRLERDALVHLNFEILSTDDDLVRLGGPDVNRQEVGAVASDVSAFAFCLDIDSCSPTITSTYRDYLLVIVCPRNIEYGPAK